MTTALVSLGRRFERQSGQKWAEEIAPIRVAPSALGPNIPHRELFLSRNHCLYLDGVLIPVRDLLNNSTITRCSAEDLQEIEYFHIKLERHSVIYAEGAACETLRAVTAVNSENVEFEEYRRLYGEPSLPDEPAAPMLGYNGGRSRLRGHIRSAVSLVVDVRSKLVDVSTQLSGRIAEVPVNFNDIVTTRFNGLGAVVRVNHSSFHGSSKSRFKKSRSACSGNAHTNGFLCTVVFTLSVRTEVSRLIAFEIFT